MNDMLTSVHTTSPSASCSTSTSMQSFTIATMNQLCKVCGEPAAGFHFGAFTCEGCKSFFGRTYNNLSQVHECKNGGQCVINKQNRTSCKACRLRKCLMVGMSKTGSRYGRRSNWFKIHCLLQEQANYNGQPPNIRTPITPTLQDGSLPFVSAHLRDSIGRDGPIRPPAPMPPPPEIHNPDLQNSLSGLSSTSQIGCVERRLQEEALKALTRGSGHQPTSQDFETHYREQVLELLKRSQNIENFRRTPDIESIRRIADIDPIRRSHDFETIDSMRHVAPDVDNRLGPMAVLEWERRVREASRRMHIDGKFDRKDHNLLLEMKNEHRPQECQSESSSCTKIIDNSDQEVVSVVNDDPIKIEYEQTNEPISISDECEKSKGNSSPPKYHDKKSTGVLMSEEERLSFLKSVNNHSSLYSRDHMPAVSSPVRVTPNADLLYSPLNNNIFQFPAYPPLWPSMIPFTPFSKFYPPFGNTIPPNNLEAFKKSIFNPADNAAAVSGAHHRLAKEDAVTKKRFLDAVLQVQRQSVSPLGPSSVGRTSQPQLSISPVGSSPSVTPAVSQASHHDQPMDLTVRRKRKMDKSEIIYNPGEDLKSDDHIESEDDRDEKWLKRDNELMRVEEDVGETILEEEDDDVEKELTKTELVESENEAKSEVPLKLIKLDSHGETLVV